jgi:hypothetical protein
VQGWRSVEKKKQFKIETFEDVIEVPPRHIHGQGWETNTFSVFLFVLAPEKRIQDSVLFISLFESKVEVVKHFSSGTKRQNFFVPFGSPNIWGAITEKTNRVI